MSLTNTYNRNSIYGQSAANIMQNHRQSFGWGNGSIFDQDSLLDFHAVANNARNRYGMAHSYNRAAGAYNHAAEITKDKDAATLGGAAGTGLALKMFGVAGLGKAFGLTALGVGAASAPIIGLGMAAAGGALGGLALLKTAPFSKEIVKAAGRVAFKGLEYGLNKSIAAVKATHRTYNANALTKSSSLDEISKSQKQREARFKGFVKDTRKSFMDKKNIKDELKGLYSLKVPTAKARKSLNNLTADYLIKSSTKNKQVDFKALKTNIDNFAKDVKLSKAEAKELKGAVSDRIEKYKDNFVLDKNARFTKHKGPAKQKAKQQLNKENKKIENIKQQKKQMHKERIEKGFKMQQQRQQSQQKGAKQQGKQQGR